MLHQHVCTIVGRCHILLSVPFLNYFLPWFVHEPMSSLFISQTFSRHQVLTINAELCCTFDGIAVATRLSSSTFRSSMTISLVGNPSVKPYLYTCILVVWDYCCNSGLAVFHLMGDHCRCHHFQGQSFQ